MSQPSFLQEKEAGDRPHPRGHIRMFSESGRHINTHTRLQQMVDIGNVFPTPVGPLVHNHPFQSILESPYGEKTVMGTGGRGVVVSDFCCIMRSCLCFNTQRKSFSFDSEWSAAPESIGPCPFVSIKFLHISAPLEVRKLPL